MTSNSTHADAPVAPGAEPATRAAVIALCAQTCATLEDLDSAAKGRASIVRSCSESRTITEDDREALKELLRCITEQRKRLRAVRRMWQSIDGLERPSASLVEATQLCLRESREMAVALDPWRLQTVAGIARSIESTWSRLGAVAEHFAAAPGVRTAVRMVRAV